MKEEQEKRRRVGDKNATTGKVWPVGRRRTDILLHNMVQGFSIPTFVIGKDHKIIFWNRALEKLSNITADQIVGTNQQWRAFYAEERPCMADLIVDGITERIPKWYADKYHKSDLIDEAYEATDFFPDLGDNGRWLRFTAALIRDSKGELVGAVETLEGITAEKTVGKAQKRKSRRRNKPAYSFYCGTKEIFLQ